jgi:large subunit ribosomal protein L20
MPRVKRGTHVRRRHAALLALTKGYRHGRKNLYRQAKQAMLKAGQHAFRDRRTKKRVFRRLWIVRLNAAVRAHGLTYRDFTAKATAMNLGLNRKVLSELAVQSPEQFAAVVERVRAS